MLLCVMLSMTIVIGSRKADADEPTYVKIVNPVTGNQWFSYTSQNKSMGDTFNVSITIANVASLFCYQIALQYDTSLLEFVNLTYPSDFVFAELKPVTSRWFDQAYGGWFGACVGRSEFQFSGSGVLGQVEFRIKKAIGESNVSFFEGGGFGTFLEKQYSLDDIPFTPVIAYYDYNFQGDVNYDGVINMKDVNLAVQAFNSFPDTPRWNPRADVDHNGHVDMRDINTVVINFGKHI